MTDQTKAADPEQIWLSPICTNNDRCGRTWCEDEEGDDCCCVLEETRQEPHPFVRYIRADVAEKRIAELEGKLTLTPEVVWRALNAWSDDSVDNDESSEYSRIEAALLAVGFQEPEATK